MKSNLMIAASCLALMPGLGLANQIQLSFIPGSQTVFAGSTMQVAVGISLLNIGGPPSLGAYDLSVLFDPSLFSYSSVAFGDPVLGDQLDLFGLGNIQSSTPGTGSVNLFELSLDSASDIDALQAGDFTLFTLSFLALSPGTSPLSMSVNALSDAIGAPISFAAGDGSASAVNDVSTPEPATSVLLGLGTALLVVRRVQTSR